MSAQVGVKNLYYAKMTTEDTASSAPVYGDMKELLVGKLVDIGVDVETEEASIYADDAKYDEASAITDITVSINVAELPLEAQADLLGHTVTNGVMDAKSDDVAPYVGLAFEFTKKNGKKRFVKLFKGTFKEVSEQGQTKGQSIEFQTKALEGSFMPLKNNKLWKKVADEEATGYTDTTGTNWYSSML